MPPTDPVSRQSSYESLLLLLLLLKRKPHGPIPIVEDISAAYVNFL